MGGAEDKLAEAHTAADDAAAAASAAAAATIEFGPHSLDAIVESEGTVCITGLTTDPSYVAAKAAAAAATEEASSTAAAIAGLETALTEAQEEAAHMVQKCQCDTYKGYTDAWTTAQAGASGHEESYMKGQHMKCVLAGTDPSACDTGTTPAVVAVTLADGVDAAACEGLKMEILDESNTHLSECTDGKKNKIHYLDRQEVDCRPWEYAAHEGGSVAVGDTPKLIRYGAEGNYVEKELSGSVSCSNGVFGDPLPGHTKECWVVAKPAAGTGKVMNEFVLKACNGVDNDVRYHTTCHTAGNFAPETEHKTTCGIGVNEDLQYLDRYPVKCPTGSALTFFELQRCEGSSDHQQYHFRCSDIGVKEEHTYKSGCNVAVNHYIHYLDRHNVNCPEGSALTGFRFGTFGCTGQNMQYEYTCGVEAWCDHGYTRVPGDTPGWGSINGHGGGEAVEDCSACASFCDGEPTCKAYECSPTAKLCNLNTGATPANANDYNDYRFCVKP